VALSQRISKRTENRISDLIFLSGLLGFEVNLFQPLRLCCELRGRQLLSPPPVTTHKTNTKQKGPNRNLRNLRNLIIMLASLACPFRLGASPPPPPAPRPPPPPHWSEGGASGPRVKRGPAWICRTED
jgi:hypothetical protein